jgi:hypothetical protein
MGRPHPAHVPHTRNMRWRANLETLAITEVFKKAQIGNAAGPITTRRVLDARRPKHAKPNNA